MTEENGYSDDRPIRLRDIAAKVGQNPNGFLRAARRRGYEPFKLREGKNKPYFLSPQDAKALIQKFEDESKYLVNQDQKNAPTGLSGVYVIEVPSYDGSTRLKIGWSDKVADRLDTYRTIVPDLRVLRIWPCVENWYERMALKWPQIWRFTVRGFAATFRARYERSVPVQHHFRHAHDQPDRPRFCPRSDG